MSIYSDSERRPVFFRIGTLNAFREKFIKAPFDLVKVAGDWFVEPQSIGSETGNQLASYLGANSDIADDDQDTEQFLMGREEGWHSLNAIIVERHEMGALTDNWIGVHRFGLL